MPAKVPSTIVTTIKYDGESVSKMLAVLAKATSKIMDMKKIAAAAACMHAIHHGNATPMTQFIKACGEGERNDAIVAWALNYGPFKWEHDKDLKANVFKMDTDKAIKLREKGDDYIKTLLATPYWVFKKQTEVPAFTTIQALKAIVKRGKKAMEDESAKAKSDFRGFAEIEALLAKLEPANTIAA